MARASCVTKFCPRLEHIELPPINHTLMWARDGLPHYIVLKMTQWKGRKSRTPYKLRVWRNLLCDFADPVFFLMLWIAHLKSLGITSGPIFPHLTKEMAPTGGRLMKTRQWTKMVQHVFKKVRCTGRRACRDWPRACVCDVQCGLWKPGRRGGARAEGLTSHSHRKAGAEWAARCGASVNDIMNTGRWKDTGTVTWYLAQGTMYGEQQAADFCGEDPIFKFWVYRPTSEATDGGASNRDTR